MGNKFVSGGLLALVASVTAFASPPATVVPYRETGAAESDAFKVTVNDTPVFVAKHFDFSYAHFAFAGTVEVKITAHGGTAGYVLSPKSYGLPQPNGGKEVTFTLTVPRKLLLWRPQGVIDQCASEGEERMGVLREDKLAIFADPLEDGAPSLLDSSVLKLADYGGDLQKAVDAAASRPGGGTVWVPPGLFGGATLKSNVAIYLSPGAVLKRPLFAEGVKNIRVYGRGVLNCGTGDAFRAVASTGVRLEDFITIDAGTAVLHESFDATLYNLKSMRFSRRAQTFDGNGTTHLLIDNVFFWASDDATAIGYRHNQHDVCVRNSVLGTWMTGSPLKTHGSFRPGQREPMYTAIKDFTMENNDLLIGERLASVIQDCGGMIENYVYKNLRYEYTLGNSVCDVGYSTWNRERNRFGYGLMRNFSFSNIACHPAGAIILTGVNNEHPLVGITFDNFVRAGQLIREHAQLQIVGPVENIQFRQHEPVFVSVVASRLYARVGEPGEFTVRRTGPTDSPLTLRYKVRGTAEAGIDYEALPGEVTIAAGQSSATIPVRVLRSIAGELKTVLIALENARLDPTWSLGPDYHAVVNLVGQP